MGSIGVEIVDICLEDSEQMVVIADEQMVQALAAHRTDEPFTDGIGARRTKRGLDDFNLGPSGDRSEMLPILLVVIANKVFWALTEWRGFPQSLGYPSVGRMARHTEMYHPPRT